jgi:Fur family transcriptional regulator, ferric uptake regulator
MNHHPSTKTDTDHAIGKLRDAGVRVTQARVMVMQFFLDAQGGHYSPEHVHYEVCRRARPVHVSSAYRVLSELCSARLLTSVMLNSTRVVYELNVGAPHDHLVCVDCSRVLDFIDPILSARRQAIASARGFRIEPGSLVIHGTCHRCDATVQAPHN